MDRLKSDTYPERSMYHQFLINFQTIKQGAIPILLHQKDGVGGLQNGNIFAEVLYCIYADKVGGLGPKDQNYADIL